MKNKRKILIGALVLIICVLSAAAVLIYFFADVNINLIGSADTEAQVFTEYFDEGCTAKYLWLDISDRLRVRSDVDTETLGDYTVVYSLTYHGKEYSVTRHVKVNDTAPPEINLKGDSKMTVSSMSLYDEPGYEAFDNYDGNLSEKVKISKSESSDGTCTVTYTVSDSFGNTAEAERIVTIKDIVPPVLTLSGEENLEINTPDYIDPGCTAIDDLDEDISEKITVSTDYVRGTEGVFTFNYSVCDAAGNKAEASRTVTVTDNTAPEITLNGGTYLYLCRGEAYTERGFGATDDFDGDVGESITVSGSPDTNTAGEYAVIYSAEDSKGNRSQKIRTVRVYEKPTPIEGAVNGHGMVSGSTVYLTFDDGPSNIITPRILDILKENNVKATFFIVNYSDGNKPLLSRMIDEGHTIGIHGYSHDYAAIYSSPEAFLDNIESLRRRLIDDFGYSTDLIRFPGGSSNIISRRYSAGIMSTLCPLVEQLGYHYFDWNISSGDAAGGHVSRDAVIGNVINGLKHGRGNVVLMHDTNAKGSTADALQEIIDRANADGYTFAALSSYSDGAHHNVQN
ncbi:MAG: DUF5011 domain-containing protein [Clostridiales bacterium]|nr:DUF5011 domain-containing protein [Clostridiales bacterium]